MFSSLRLKRNMKALSHPSFNKRLDAVNSLGIIGSPLGVDGLIIALKDSEWYIRQRAIDWLGKIQDGRSVDAMIASLSDENRNIVSAAADSLDKINPKWRQIGSVQKLVSDLVSALGDKNHEVRVRAAFTLGAIRDQRAVDVLTLCLEDDESSVRNEAVDALSKISDNRVVELLTSVLHKEKDSGILTRIAYALGRIEDPRSVEPLIDTLKSSNLYYHGDLRTAAAWALGRLKDAQAYEPLITTRMHDRYTKARNAAAESLTKLDEIADPRWICSICKKTASMIIEEVQDKTDRGVWVIGNDLLGYCSQCNAAFCSRDCMDTGVEGVCPKCSNKLVWSHF